jgi:hypothetical protein
MFALACCSFTSERHDIPADSKPRQGSRNSGKSLKYFSDVFRYRKFLPIHLNRGAPVGVCANDADILGINENVLTDGDSAGRD